ncbi:MAG: zinc-ribbon domain-containing protein [Burkholderiaceae bacterium]|nr:zinc-ribbon domain-containing protein [Burkholderiaceae bacterium]
MNLATRCTACGTMFRVVQDQLKVSEGWVRCGRCQAVFNAQENLFDLEHDHPPPWQPPAEAADAAAGSAPADDELATRVSFTPEDHGDVAEPTSSPDADPTWAEAGVPAEEAALEPAAEAIDLPAPAEWDDEPAAEPAPADDTPSDAPAAEDHTTATAAAEGADAAASSAPADAPPEATPAFLRQAARNERWERPPVRRMLWALVAVSALLLATQVIHHFRQVIAAQHPGALPWLQGFCGVTGCRLDTLQRIADVSIENTALTQGQGPAQAVDDAASAPDSETHILRLAITLRNRGPWTIAMPSVDLSLTGSDGELVARRSLSPRDFGVIDPQLTPGLDTPLSLRFRVIGGRVSGYTVEVFYP